jgi:membrane-bound lytic murein transglycosylase B
MQFLPATFAAYALPVPPGGAAPPSPYDPTDAVYAAARLLCADGARDGADVRGAVYAYNHSPAYVAQVLSLAAAYAAAP